MTTLKKSTRPDRGACRMGIGAGLFVIGAPGVVGGSLLGLALVLIAVVLFVWGAQRAFVGPTLPRVAEVLERTARELRS